MRLAIVSDIHDHIQNLRTAILFLAERTDLMICCGDLCSPFIIDELKKYPKDVHSVFGNNDADLFRITRKSDNRVQVHGEFLDLNLDGFRLAVNHFDNIALPIAQSHVYDLVCFGHNHRFSRAQYGRTTALNPGTLMGWAFGSAGAEHAPATVAIFDTATANASLFSVDGDTCAERRF